MKKTALLFALLLLLLTLPAHAAQDFHVYDEADLLTDDEEAKLTEMAADLSAQYDCGIHLAVVEDYTELSDARGIEAFAEEFYHENLLGFGAERNGILLTLSMAERDYDLCAYGEAAHTAFTDYGKEVLSEEFLDDFGYDDWYSGFYDYVIACGDLLEEAESGTPVDVGSGHMAFGTRLLIIFVPSLLIALIVCLVFLSQMKTARRRGNAADYVCDGGIHMYIRQDFFTHRTTRRQVIQSSSGGTKINSGGFSHRSGKF